MNITPLAFFSGILILLTSVCSSARADNPSSQISGTLSNNTTESYFSPGGQPIRADQGYVRTGGPAHVSAHAGMATVPGPFGTPTSNGPYWNPAAGPGGYPGAIPGGYPAREFGVISLQQFQDSSPGNLPNDNIGANSATRDRLVFQGPPRTATGVANVAPFGSLISLEGLFGDGAGYETNLFRVHTFLPAHVDPGRSLVFASLNGSVNREGDAIGNFGAGYRVWMESLNRIFTVSGWLDMDDGNAQTYYRAGTSISSLGKFFDFRFNTYFILNNNQSRLQNVITGNPFFQGNQILLNQKRRFESAYGGGDVEIGGPLPLLGHRGVNGYVGGYLLVSNQDEDALGVRFRVEVNVADDVHVGVNISNDRIFGTNTFASVSWTFPDGRPRNWFRPRKVRGRLAEQVRREIRIPVHLREETDVPVAAINPADGMPFFVAHIDPNAAVAGTGTFESPIQNITTFVNAANIDIIRVLPRADNTNTNLDLAAGGPLVLSANQRLLSTTLQHTFTATQGTFQLPGFTAAGNGPRITSDNNIIHVASNNEISGFILDGAGTNNVISNPAAIVGFNFNNNTVTNAVSGITLTNATGTGLITNNTITGHTTDGISINNTAAGTLNLGVTGNTVNTNTVNGLELIVANAGAVINANNTVNAALGVFNNTFNTNGTGILLTATAGTINLVGGTNTINGNTAPNTGFHATATGATSFINLLGWTNNTITNNTGNGVRLDAVGGGTVTVASFTGNTVTGNNANNLLIQSTGAASRVTGAIGVAGQTANSFNGAVTGAGIRINTDTTGVIGAGAAAPFIIANNQIGTAASPNSTAGIHSVVDGGTFDLLIGGTVAGSSNQIVSDGAVLNTGILGTFSDTTVNGAARRLNVIGNTITEAGSSGILLTTANATTLTAGLTSNTITGSGTGATDGHAIALQTINPSTSTLNATITNSTLDNSDGGSGLFVQTNIGGTTNVTVTGSTLRNNGSPTNGGNGVTLQALGGTSSLTVQNNTISGSVAGGGVDGDGIRVNVESGATVSSLLIGGASAALANSITGNAGDGIELEQNGTGTITTANIQNNSITNNTAGNGILYDVNPTGAGGVVTNPITITNNTVTGNGLAGFFGDFLGTMSGTVSLTLANNTFSTNGREGVLVRTDSNTQQGISVLFEEQTGNIDPDTNINAEWLALGAAYLTAGTPADEGQYLNLTTVLNVNFTATGNTIQGNGTAGVATNDDGMQLQFGTGSKLLATVSNNTFGNANAGVDFSTSSFISTGGATPDAVVGDLDAMADGNDTRIFLDDTAQFDLVFTGNSSNDNTVNVSAAGAFYTTNGTGKNVPGVFNTAGVAGAPDAFDNRPGFLAEVNGSTTLNTGNTFILGGTAVDINALFSANRFNLRATAGLNGTFAGDQPLPQPVP